MRGRDYKKAPDGRMVYQNRYVLWGHAVWGRITDYEAYEDASKKGQLDGLRFADPSYLPLLRHLLSAKLKVSRTG